MTYSTMNDKTAHHAVATIARAEDGYFGWTDRYGVRPSFFPEKQAPEKHGRPYLIPNS